MQGCGNDFIVAQIDIFGMNVEAYPSLTTFTLKEKELISRKCVQVCDRHFGIGADGVLLITVNDKSVWKMTAINSDGTWALMCGNGLRCVAALLSSKYGQGSKFEI